MNGIWDGKYAGRWRTRKRFRRWVLVIREEERRRRWRRRRRRIRRCKSRKCSTARASSDSSVLLVSAPKFSIQVVAFSLQLHFIDPTLLSHISPSRHRQLGPPRRLIPRLHFEVIIPIVHVFRSASWWWLVSGVLGKNPPSIVLLTIENILPLLVDDRRNWVSL